MKRMIEQGKKYGFADFIRIPFWICPLYGGIKITNRVITSLLPSVQVLATAAFVDKALEIFSGTALQEAIVMPLLSLMLIIAYNYLSWQLMGFVNLKAEMRMTTVYRTEIAQKRASLEYRHIEDNDTWELINRVCNDPVGKMNGGFENIMGAAGIFLRVGSLLLILMTQVWWAGIAIVAMSVPLFSLAVRSGRKIYEENKESQKFSRRADYLKSVMQGRENVEERALFGYTETVNLKDLTAFAALSETEGALVQPADSGNTAFESLEFRHVSFRYPGTEQDILKDFDLRLEGGKHYAFVGVNGAGKTTITKLLTGLYDNYGGEILLNGRELRSYPMAQRKAFFSVVYQDFAKYQIPLEDNIYLGNVRKRDTARMEEAAGVIGLRKAVDALPEGFRTPLGKIRENGVDLSGGEWQRLAIARTLYSEAAMQILDEPTAALDPVAESGIYELFGRISAGKSAIFITHRLGAARLADEIIVIDDGKVAEKGSHEALLFKNGIYASMFEAQRSWYQ